MGEEAAIFTRDVLPMEVLQAGPRARDVFAAYDRDCLGCMGMSMVSQPGASPPETHT